MLAGALLIVGGGVALAARAHRPDHVRTIGIVYALAGAALFALRDNLVRAPLARHGRAVDDRRRGDARGGARRHDRVRRRPQEPRRLAAASVVARWLLPGAMVGLSYVALFEAFYRGTVSVVAPIVGTESLWGVAFSALLLHKTESVGRRLVLGALLVVAGGGLIAITR